MRGDRKAPVQLGKESRIISEVRMDQGEEDQQREKKLNGSR
jgi:hypothetical protein